LPEPTYTEAVQVAIDKIERDTLSVTEAAAKAGVSPVYFTG
jgi:hypothetical protein